MEENKYGFNGRLKEEFPSQVIASMTGYCNYACTHCPQANISKSKVYDGPLFTEELNKKMVDEVSTDGKGYCQHIRYTAGGEPMTHPQIMNFLEYACKNSGVLVSLTTNGSYLTEKNRKQLLNIGMGMIDISIDANTKETYESIRVNGKFENVQGNVLSLLSEKLGGGV